MNILVVEDERSLANAVKRLLEQQGYIVETVGDGLSAVEYVKSMDFRLIILDVMLPKLDGFDVVRILRKDGIDTPVLMLTAKSAVGDVVAGLNYGADDYMAKPFDSRELIARVAALTRRRGEVVIDRVKYSDIELDVNSAELCREGRSVQLSKKEFEVLKAFLYNPNMTITTESLLNGVWGADSEATDNNVEVYISFIRKKLKFLKSEVGIRKIQKIGYRLEAAV